MSNRLTSKSATATASCLNAEEVIAYLKKNPDFFERYPTAIEELTLKHDADVASLLEKQIEVLRHKNQDLSDQITLLIETARSNENSSFSLHRFALALLQSLSSGKDAVVLHQRIGQVEKACQSVLQKSFPEVQIVFHWFREFAAEGSGYSLISYDEPRISGLVQRIFSNGRPDCGPFNEAESAVLFAAFDKQCKSAVIMPLSVPSTGVPIGLFVIMSRHQDKFIPGKGTIFVTQIRQLIEYFLLPSSAV